jgi:hypothetical protein
LQSNKPYYLNHRVFSCACRLIIFIRPKEEDMEKESVLETMYEDAPSDWDRFSSDVDMMDIEAEAEAEAEAVGLEDVPLNNQCATSGVEKPQVQSQKDLASPLSAGLYACM